MLKKWQIFPEMEKGFKNKYPEINPITLQLLFNRGIISQEAIDEFLNPDYGDDSHDPFLFKDMRKAVGRILAAIESNEKITVFGDYDADGITSTVLLQKALIEISKILDLRFENCAEKEGEKQSKILNQKSKIDIYIPHRGKEGYGLNNAAIEYIKEKGGGLIITVDCGISNKNEIAHAAALGLDVIITDHHQPPQELPDAFAIINPKIENEKYPFKELAGVGVAFKLAQGLMAELRIKNQELRMSKSSKGERVSSVKYQALSKEQIKQRSKNDDEKLEIGKSVLSENRGIVKLKSEEREIDNTDEMENQKFIIRSQKLLEGVEKWLLDLVAIGTIADCCPLLGENRTLVKYGLVVLNKTKNLGLTVLMEKIGIAKRPVDSVRCDKSRITNLELRIKNEEGKNLEIRNWKSKDEKIIEAEEKAENLKSEIKNLKSLEKCVFNVNSWNVGFQIAPRLNAAGRLEHANTSYRLLITTDREEAEKIADVLNEANSKRQNLTQITTAEAIEIIEREQKNNSVFFTFNPAWEAGIIGLVAGKIAEYYHRPAFVFTKIGGEIVASGRSIPGFNLMEALSSVKEFLSRYGGHSQACGLSLKKGEFYDEFCAKFKEAATRDMRGLELSPITRIDRELNYYEIDWGILDEIKQFEPYGIGNKEPLFLLKNARILEVRLLGNEGRHIKMKLGVPINPPQPPFIKGGSKIINAIGFNLNGESEWGKKIKLGDMIDVAGYLNINEWNGNREIQIKIIDMHLSNKE